MPTRLLFSLHLDKARNIKNRPVVNCDPQVTRLQEMRKEIDALREELWQTQQAVSENKSTTVGTVGLSAATEVSPSRKMGL